MTTKKKYNWKEIGFLCSVGIVPLIHFIVFYIYMNMDSFFLAFQTTTANGITWGFENFKKIYGLFSTSGTGELARAATNTLIWMCVTVFLYIPQMLSTYFVFKKVPGAKFIVLASMLPSLLPASSYVGFIKYILAPEGGIGYLFTNYLDKLPPFLLSDSDYANNTMIIFTIWRGLGITLLWMGAMNNISPEILEAGLIDGTNWFSELIKIIIPLIWPTLSVSMMFTVAGLLGSSGPILVFTNGAYGTTTLSFWIFQQTRYSSNYELAATLGFIMTVISVPLVLLVRKIADKVEEY